jgi:hypothetical protein
VLGQEIDVHHRRVGEKWDIMNPRHVGNRGPPASIDIELVGLQNFVVDRYSVRRLKAGMALDDRTICRSSESFLHSLA